MKGMKSFRQAHELKEAGYTERQISDKLKLPIQTVQRYLRHETGRPLALSNAEFAKELKSYLAGVIDWKGCISHNVVDGKKYFRFVLTSNDRTKLEKLQALTNLGNVSHHTRSRWQWQVSATNEVKQLYTAVVSYLKIRQVEVRKVLNELSEEGVDF